MQYGWDSQVTVSYFHSQISLVKLFSEEAAARVKNNIHFLVNGKLNSNDTVIKAISDKIMENKSYCFEHPLKRNF